MRLTAILQQRWWSSQVRCWWSNRPMWGVITNTSIQSYTPDRRANSSLITESLWLLDTEMLLFCYRRCKASQMDLSACFYSPVVDGSCKVSLSPCYTVCLGLPEIGKNPHNYLQIFIFLMKSLKLNSFYISPSLWGSKFLFWNGWVQGWVLIPWDPWHSFTSLCNNSFFFWDPGWIQG